MMKKNIRNMQAPLWVALFLLLVGLTQMDSSAASMETKRILILNSYHHGYSWTDGETAGILEAFSKAKLNVEPIMQELDCKSFPKFEHFDALKNLLKKKLTLKPVSLVFVLDNPALDFALKYRGDLFPDIPIVFMGINGYHPETLRGVQNITGSGEKLDVAGTIALARILQPDIKEVVLIHDDTSTGLKAREDAEIQFAEHDPGIAIRYLPPLPMRSLQEIVRHLPKTSIALISSFSRDGAGVVFNQNEVTRILSEEATVPIYVVHEERIGTGVIGGLLLQGKAHGAQAGALGVRILSGEKASSIPVITKLKYRTIFDYRALKKFKIPVSRVPAGSEIINQPVNFYILYKAIINSTVVFILMLSFIIFILANNIYRRKKTIEALRQSEEKFRNLVRDMPVGVLIQGLKTEIIMSNPKALELLGLSEDQLLGRTSFDPDWSVIHEDGSPFPGATHPAAEAIATKHSIRHVIMGVTRPFFHDRVWLSVNAEPQLNKDGSVCQVVVSFVDITSRKQAEEALQKRDALFANISSQVPGMLYQFIRKPDGSFSVPYSSAGVNDIFGCSPDDVHDTFDPIFKAILPEDRNKIIQTIEESIKTLSQWMCEYRVQLPGKEIKWVFGNSIPEKMADGSIVWSGYNTDITERKQAEKALKEKSEELDRYFTSSLDLLCIAHMDGHFIRLNPEWEKVLGYSLQEMEGQMFIDFVHPNDIANTLSSVSKLSGQQQILSFENRFRCKDGSYRWIEWRSQPQGELIYAAARDITERKRVEQELRLSEEKFSSLFSSMTEMVALHEVVFDENGKAINYRITDCNNAYSLVTGIQKKDAIGKLATEVYQAETPPYLEEFTQVGITGKSYEYITYYAPMDKHFSISVVSPKQNTFATITTDITAIKQVQEIITSKNKELENYLYIASHDLRSPLVNIQGFSQRLKKQTDAIKEIITSVPLAPETKTGINKIADEEIPKTLDFISSSVTKMDVLLNGLLQISRTGRTLMVIRQIDIDQLFKTILGNYNFQISEINATIDIKKLSPCFGDENMLSQLFSNIIGNAIKYREPQRPLVIEISSRVESKKTIYSIKDNGIGIDPRHLDKIWDVFYRVDASLVDAGDGLGLSIVKRITEKNHGKVWAESESGKGTVFHIELQNTSFME